MIITHVLTITYRIFVPRGNSTLLEKFNFSLEIKKVIFNKNDVLL